MSEWITLREAAVLLGKPYKTVYGYVRWKTLRHKKAPARMRYGYRLLVNKSEVLELRGLDRRARCRRAVAKHWGHRIPTPGEPVVPEHLREALHEFILEVAKSWARKRLAKDTKDLAEKAV